MGSKLPFKFKGVGFIRELIGVDLFDFPVIAITTNGFVKNNGECVMGRGCAQTARDTYPGIASKLGGYIKKYGNRCFSLGRWGVDNKLIFTFVVKHTWSDEASVELITRSCLQLSEMLTKYNVEEIHIPRPGCGNGKLKWSDIKPIIEPLLDDRFVVVHKRHRMCLNCSSKSTCYYYKVGDTCK